METKDSTYPFQKPTQTRRQAALQVSTLTKMGIGPESGVRDKIQTTNLIALIQICDCMHNLEAFLLNSPGLASLASGSDDFRGWRDHKSARQVQTVVIVAPPWQRSQSSEVGCDEKIQEQPQRRWKKEAQWEREGAEGLKMEEEEREEGANSAELLRVNKKNNKKGKRDGENIRTYARYDSLIQTLEEQLSLHSIFTKNIDQNLFDHFDMKSKRSLQRYFFYLCLAKREGNLTSIIPELRRKTKKKVLEKGGHRTTEFIETLQGCIDCYITAAEMLDSSTNHMEAGEAFKHAYLYDEGESLRVKRPHHNQIKGIEKCMRIYHEIMEGAGSSYLTFSPREQEIPTFQSRTNTQKMNDLARFKTNDVENPDFIPFGVEGTGEKSEIKIGDRCADGEHEEGRMQEEPREQLHKKRFSESRHVKKKLLGVKNKKQDDRDIQKYAKFDIVSESSLEFCKHYKIYKSIPESTRKLSQRSLHFFFVILALIEKERLQEPFFEHLNRDYYIKVDRRYTQRSPYFREQLKKSFRNLVDSTKLLFQGKLQEALETAYEVKPEKRTHPAKANQLKKCKQIYEETLRNFDGGKGENNRRCGDNEKYEDNGKCEDNEKCEDDGRCQDNEKCQMEMEESPA